MRLQRISQKSETVKQEEDDERIYKQIQRKAMDLEMEVQKYEKRLLIQQKLQIKNKQKLETVKKWEAERERHKQIMAKVPVFEKLKYEH